MAVAARKHSSIGRHAHQRLPGPVQDIAERDVEVAGQRGGIGEVADFRIAQAGIDGQEQLADVRLDDLPLDVRKNGRFGTLFVVIPPAILVGLRFGLAAARLPAVADLGRRVTASRLKRYADDLDSRVGKQNVHETLPLLFYRTC